MTENPEIIECEGMGGGKIYDERDTDNEDSYSSI